MLRLPLVRAAAMYLLSSIVVSSPAIVNAQVSVPGFTYFGEGECRDANNEGYDYYYIWISGAVRCGSECSGISNGGELVGFMSINSNCFCHFENGFVDWTQPLPSGFTGYSVDFIGTGSIENLRANTGYACYKVEVPPQPSQSPSLKPSLGPSIEPSLKPSVLPSLFPSLKPSLEPSLVPSAAPSLQPSLKPSSSPSDVPSLQPTDVPSLTPSAQPSNAPSDLPSASPSMAPSISAAPSTTPSAPPTRPEPQIEIDFDGFCLNFVNSTLPVATYTDFFAILGDAMEAEILNHLNPLLTTPGQRILRLTVTDIDGKAISRRLEEEGGRQLANSLTEVKYNLTFEQFCTRGNCDDATQLTQAALDFLIANVGELVNSAAFLAALKDDLITNHGIAAADLTKMVTTQSGDCTPTFVVNSIFPMMYYPDWTGANTGCIADGNEAEYMRLNPEGYYLFDKLEDCCSRHYDWTYNECAGIDNAALGPDGQGLYYPDWEGDNKSCKNDGGQPDYMSNNPTTWMFETLEACCTTRYSWNLDECIGTVGSTSSLGSNMWYPNWEGFVCVQDCVGPSPCGGLAENWDPLFDTVEACCDSKLNWVSECVTKSGGTSTTTGGATVAASTTSGKWYVDYSSDSCKQDCVGNAPCGGAAANWETLYPSVSACCKGKLWWIDDCGSYTG